MRLRSDRILFGIFGTVTLIATLTACSFGQYSGSGLESAAAQRNVAASSQDAITAARMKRTLAPRPISRARFTAFDSCPARGPIEYVPDYNNNVINIYKGKLSGQAACARLTSAVASPWGMYVQPLTHDLYVANALDHNILAFHRGHLEPYAAYTDPTSQAPVDVVETDGVLIASNLTQTAFLYNGSLSTWVEGADGGKFIGNFPFKDNGLGQYLTAVNGIIYFDDLPNQTNNGAVWRVSCPAGVCGKQTQVAGVTLTGPGGMAYANDDLLAVEGGAAKTDTFELPSPVPSSFSVIGYPTGIAFDQKHQVLFIADGFNNQVLEYTYPGGLFIGKVLGDQGGGTFGVAVDPD